MVILSRLHATHRVLNARAGAAWRVLSRRIFDHVRSKLRAFRGERAPVWSARKIF
jgi:hypothetical protein